MNKTEPSIGVCHAGPQSRQLTSDCCAVVLAGGLGTRLRSVYDSGPKCMAPVGGTPFLEHLLRRIAEHGIEHVVLCIGYLGRQIRDYFGDGLQCGVNLSYAVEEELLGTAGALKNAERLLGHPFCFVLNGDSFLDVDYSGMLEFHRTRGAELTIALAKCSNPARYGRVLLDDNAAITAFVEKAATLPSDQSGAAHHINGGVYLLQTSLIQNIPPGQACSLEREIFPALLGRSLFGYSVNGYFIDIGVPEDFERAQVELPRFLTE